MDSGQAVTDRESVTRSHVKGESRMSMANAERCSLRRGGWFERIDLFTRRVLIRGEDVYSVGGERCCDSQSRVPGPRVCDSQRCETRESHEHGKRGKVLVRRGSWFERIDLIARRGFNTWKTFTLWAANVAATHRVAFQDRESVTRSRVKGESRMSMAASRRCSLRRGGWFERMNFFTRRGFNTWGRRLPCGRRTLLRLTESRSGTASL
jgi:hypothetical protein